MAFLNILTEFSHPGYRLNLFQDRAFPLLTTCGILGARIKHSGQHRFNNSFAKMRSLLLDECQCRGFRANARQVSGRGRGLAKARDGMGDGTDLALFRCDDGKPLVEAHTTAEKVVEHSVEITRLSRVPTRL
ncbi:hypothetical protein CVM39_17895 [Pseudooceanicola antarcticus]|uniref:Uncharacterized protein n=1 Tax=Pseudooceanicola antarcticus TaxID=1247613 RepID=A0ABX4MJG4_9RHOB|nr:hypothetical protein CVM39_17895 [Pseudooceanicola antarcticus]